MTNRTRVACKIIETLSWAEMIHVNRFLWIKPGAKPVLACATGGFLHHPEHKLEMAVRHENRRTLRYDIVAHGTDKDPETRLWSGVIYLPMTEQEARETGKALRQEIDEVLRPWRYENA